MSVLRNHTRQAGLLTNVLALALLTLPVPTQAVERSECAPSVTSSHTATCQVRQSR